MQEAKLKKKFLLQDFWKHAFIDNRARKLKEKDGIKENTQLRLTLCIWSLWKIILKIEFQKFNFQFKSIFAVYRI